MGLVPSTVVTVILTAPPLIDEPSGDVTVRLVLDVTLTLVPGLLPKSTVMPLTNPVPPTVTEVPPAMGPLGGLTLLTVGGGS